MRATLWTGGPAIARAVPSGFDQYAETSLLEPARHGRVALTTRF